MPLWAQVDNTFASIACARNGTQLSVFSIYYLVAFDIQLSMYWTNP
jgi:hypothetical protein